MPATALPLTAHFWFPAHVFSTSPPYMPPIPVLTPEQSKIWDQRAVAAGIELATLMESAGRAVAVVLSDRYAHLLRAGVLVAAGPGNNGGDGWVLARALHHLDVPVWVTPSPPASELCERMARLARAEGVREVSSDGPWPTRSTRGGCVARHRRVRRSPPRHGIAGGTDSRPRNPSAGNRRPNRSGSLDRCRARSHSCRSHRDLWRASPRTRARP